MSWLSELIHGSDAEAPRTPVEAPNTLQSKAIVRIVDLLSEGEVRGLVNGLQSVFFDDTPVQNSDGSFNFQGVELATVNGLVDQPVLPGFSNVETEVAVGAAVVAATSVTRTITNTLATAARVTIQLPALSSQDTTTGDLNSTSVSIAIDVKPNAGSFSQVIADTITGKTVTTYNRAYRFLLPGTGPWDIRVRRLTSDSTSVTLQNSTNWATYTVIEDFQLNYPYSALAGVAIDAQQFGANVPRRNYEIYGLKIKVPTNYDPTTRVYTGIWDGTFKTAWADNPAWVFYDLITNTRYGLGQFVPASRVDKFGLYVIAQYCDALLPDGQGGQGPRYTFNGVIASTDDAMRVLVMLAGMFRGMVYWGSSGVSVASDMPSDPAKVLAPANVIDGTFNYSGTALKARHTFAFASWFNPDKAYQQDIEPIDGDPSEIAKWGWRPLEVVAFGCTSRAQANRFGRWILDSEKNQTEAASWSASFDQADLIPGEIIKIADPAYSGVDFGGRLAAVAGDGLSVTVDRPIVIESGKTYTLSVTLANDTVVDRTLTNAPGSATVLTFTPALSPLPVVNGMWILASNVVAPRQFRVISRIENAKNEFAFSALFHDPTKYARVEQNITLTAPTYTALPSGALIAPTLLAVTEKIVTSNGAARNLIVVSWQASTDTRIQRYDVNVKAPGQNWQPAAVSSTAAVSVDLYDLLAGSWGFRVRGVDGVGGVTPWLTKEPVTLNGLYFAPTSVTSFTSVFQPNVSHLSWTEITDSRQPIFYEIRKGTTWDSGSVIGRFLHPPVPSIGDGIYWIDSLVIPGKEVYGATPVSLSLTNSILPQNTKASWDELATGATGTFGGSVFFDGTFLRTGATGDLLASPDVLAILDWLSYGPQGSGTYEIPTTHQIDVGYVAPCLIAISFASSGTPTQQNFFAYDPLFDVLDFFGSASNRLVDVYPEIALSQDGTTFGAWQRYQAGIYKARKFKARMVINSLDPVTIAFCTQFIFTVYVPTRFDNWAIIGGTRTSLNKLALPSGGSTLTFLPDTQSTAGPFNGGVSSALQPSIVVAILNWQPGDVPVISNVSLSGCTVQVQNAGIGVARDTNIRPEGY